MGTFTSFTDAGSTWTWSCTGINGGSTANCSANKAICGTSDNKTYASEPLTNLCAYGSESSRTLTDNVWTWSCSNNPGVDDIGYIYKTTCGSSHGGIFTLPPSSNLCLHGSPSLVTEDSGNYTWTCTGDDSIPVSCSASNNVRKYYFQESTAQTTVTSSTYQDKVALTFTPKENSRYLIIASWAMKSGWVARSVYGKLIRSSGTPKDFNEIIYRPKDLADWIDGSAIAVESYGASPGPQTYKIQFKGQALRWYRGFFQCISMTKKDLPKNFRLSFFIFFYLIMGMLSMFFLTAFLYSIIKGISLGSSILGITSFMWVVFVLIELAIGLGAVAYNGKKCGCMKKGLKYYPYLYIISFINYGLFLYALYMEWIKGKKLDYWEKGH